MDRLRRLLGRIQRARRFRRSDYRRVWDAVSATEFEAKVSVLGSADEASLHLAAERTRQVLIDTVGVFRSDTVLEIGAGVGRVGRVLAPLCQEWIGTDVSGNMLRHMRRRLADLPNVRLLRVSGYDLCPIPSESVDLVYCTVVFMHLDEWDRFSYVREGIRVLRPGGRMFVDNFNLLTDDGWAFFLKNMTDYPPRKRPPHISKSSTPQELVAYFERAGFADIQCVCDGLWIYAYGSKPAPHR